MYHSELAFCSSLQIGLTTCPLLEAIHTTSSTVTMPPNLLTCSQAKVVKDKEEYLQQYKDVERNLHRLSGTHVMKMTELETKIESLKVCFSTIVTCRHF